MVSGSRMFPCVGILLLWRGMFFFRSTTYSGGPAGGDVARQKSVWGNRGGEIVVVGTTVWGYCRGDRGVGTTVWGNRGGGDTVEDDGVGKSWWWFGASCCEGREIFFLGRLCGGGNIMVLVAINIFDFWKIN